MIVDWENVKLKNVVSILGDGLHGTPKYDINGDYFFINGNNLNNGKILIKDSTKRSNAGEYDKYKKPLNDRTILVSINGTLGNIATYQDEKCLLGKSACYFNVLKSVSKSFMIYVVKNTHFQWYIQTYATGATIKNVSLKAMREYRFHLPPLPIQRKIAGILSAYDDLIENNARRIAILEEMAQRIYIQWFVDFKYPGHENDKLVDSGTELGMIPDGWVVAELGERIIFQRGKNITKRQIIEGEIPVVAAGIKPAYFHNQINASSPIVTISASGANAGFINLYLIDIWASDCSFINKEITDNIFYYYSLVKFRQDEITRLQRGSAQPHVYPKDIARIIIVDPKNIQIKIFETFADSIFNEIGILIKKNSNLRQTRDLLLPKLISGEVDVSDLNIDIGES